MTCLKEEPEQATRRIAMCPPQLARFAQRTMLIKLMRLPVVLPWKSFRMTMIRLLLSIVQVLMSFE